MDTLPTLCLFTKYPVPGQVKTRLAPLLGEEGAARLHRRLVERTLATMRGSGLPLCVYISGACESDFARWLGADLSFRAQGEGHLGDRLARVPGPAIIIGADIPGLSVQQIGQAARIVQDNRIVIGPAADGGYYLIGFPIQNPAIWRDIEWGSETVLKATQKNLEGAELPFEQLETLHDCDRPEDLPRWPDLAS